MKTSFVPDSKSLAILQNCLKSQSWVSEKRPQRFLEIMRTHVGLIGVMSGLGMDAEGLEFKNPLIVALGDSVTAGHFESAIPTDEAERAAFSAYVERCHRSGEPAVFDLTDARVCYLEKFRQRLIDRFETTSVSVVNSGIAGDTLLQMSKRANRDVIRYQPDLVLINGSLNWPDDLGDAEVYRRTLTGLVRRVKAETTADIILMTANGDIPGFDRYGKRMSKTWTAALAQVIREVAAAEDTCLADTHALWTKAREEGADWAGLLANGVNHPCAAGHDVYADLLMQLIG